MKHRIAAAWIAVWFLIVLAVPVCANAEAGPDFTVLITNAPEDLEVSLVTPDGVRVEMRPLRRGWESCFRLYYNYLYEAMYPEARYDSEKMKTVELTASRSMLHAVSASENLDFTLPIPDANQMHYNHLAVMELDRENNTASMSIPSYMVWRNVLLVVLRMTVTLITEGVIFLLMSYRTRRSWMVFLAVNLVTQIFLNVTITGNYLASGYWEIGFFVLEALIFITEAVVYAVLLREHPRLRGVVTALLANVVSLACGWVLLTNLPL